MSSNENEIKTPQPTEPADGGASGGGAPYESVITQVAKRIRNEPFLFVIAIAALLIGLVVLAAGLGSPDLRFIIIVIAVLAVVVILGYYLLAVLQMRAKAQEMVSAKSESQQPNSPADSRSSADERIPSQGNVTASGKGGVSIGGSVTGSPIITGNENRVGWPQQEPSTSAEAGQPVPERTTPPSSVHAAGPGSVAVGGGVTSSPIITGDKNTLQRQNVDSTDALSSPDTETSQTDKTNE